ncbi:MAG: hypothetical protein WBX25_29500 [Rhodomicrobium sp.]
MATSEQAQAKEGYHQHGLFTYAFLEGLALAGNPASNDVDIADLKKYVEIRVPELSRELSACEANGPKEYCQKPIVPMLGDSYTFARRYPDILKELEVKDNIVPKKPTHVVIAAAELFETATRGAKTAKRIEGGELVTVLNVKGNLAEIAQNGKALGFVENAKLLKLK